MISCKIVIENYKFWIQLLEKIKLNVSQKSTNFVL